MSEYRPTISVYEQSFRTAIKHGMELWWDDSTPKKRLDSRDGVSQFTRYVNNRAGGKLSEVAFSEFLLDEYGIDSQVDWRVYGDYETTDHGDIQYLVGDDGNEYPPAVEFDVKKTKPWNQWLAIRTEIYDQYPDGAPFVLTKMTMDDDLDVDPWEATGDWTTVWNDNDFRARYIQYVSDHMPVDVQIVGSTYPDEFTDMFEQGDRLYDPNTGNTLGGPLRRDNRAIHVDDLNATTDRWNRIVSEIVGDNPISYDEL